MLLGTLGTTAQSALASDLTYWSRYGDQLAIREKNWIKRFSAANPGIGIDFSAGAANYFDKVKVAIVGGEGPDVFNVTTLNVPEFAQEGLTLDLAPYLKRDKAEVNAHTVFMAAVDGGRYPANGGAVYAVPINYVTSLLYYNPDQFAAAGVAPPDASWTWERLAEAARKLTRSGNGNAADKVFGFSMGTSNYLDIQPAILSNGGSFLNAQHTAAAVDNPIAAETVSFFADMIKGGIATLSGTGPFMNGKAAMTIDGSWAIRSMQDVPHRVALLPKGKVRRALYGASDMLAVSAKAQDPDAAWTLLKANMLARGAEFYLQSGWFPVSIDIVHGAQWQGSPYNNPVFFDAAQYMTNSASLNWYQWLGDIIPVFQASLLGKTSPQQAVSKAQTIINTWIQRAQAE